MRRGPTLFLLGWVLVLGGGFLAHQVQTSGGIRVEDIRFNGAHGVVMSGLLYVPPGATEQSPAPGILAIHGYINSRETQDGFAIALSHAGYVVLALDQTGHGYSGGTVAANGYGGPDGLTYLRRLPMVDKDNVGLEGHSMGGWAVLAAAAAQPDSYRAMVLEGSATGVKIGRGLASPEGNAQFPRNLAVVYSRYDEFAPLMWEVPKARDVGRSAKLMALFASHSEVMPGRLHGAIADGTARILYAPVTTHPGDHLSREAIGDAVAWFGSTLKGGRPVGGPSWPWKETGTAIAFLGFVPLILGAFALLLALPFFRALAARPEPKAEHRDRGWWLRLAAMALIPAVTFYPFMYLGGIVLPPSRIFPQSITNQLMIWALLNAAITLAWGWRSKSLEFRERAPWGPAVSIAILAIAAGYAALLVSDVLFKVDFRFWVVALKLLGPRQFVWASAYLVPFVLSYMAGFGALNGLMVNGDRAGDQYLTALVAMAGGFLLFLVAEYAPLFLAGALPIPQEALNAIISIQFLPLLVILAFIAVFTWRRTNSALPGALMSGIFLTWYIVAGTAVQFAN